MLFDDEHLTGGVLREIAKIPKYRPFSINLPVDMFKYLPGTWGKAFSFILSMLPLRIVFWTVNTEQQFNLVKKMCTLYNH